MFEVVPFTDIGVVRETNEDNLVFLVGEFQGEEIALIVVCDGMGGLDDGENASRTVCQNLEETFANEEYETIAELKRAITMSITMSNKQLLNINMAKGKKGGTTVSCVLLADKGYLWHVGDSRIYQIKDGQVNRLTEDHTLVNKYIKDGDITEEEAKTHHQRNVILRAVGIKAGVKIDTNTFDYKDSSLVLCSDGFWHSLEDRQLVDLNNKHVSLNDLFQFAIAEGETDNITSVFVEHKSTN
ncbi:protein phosphatase 2C domain-containing protein [Bacillus thuringiensis]|jgi:PPM family protein phosphatase|uniref:Phosphatase 2C family protein n=3 Tax=Bacillus thuringiensis TaxID=1428 RepID=A0A0B5NPK6_BACTU|nr:MULTISPECIES: protein phosphatase 2C domain-containing protein [Bacillus]EAO56479.1 Protein phosphatase 2C [Bacillus thuringiensis serovar israelensis ATCC 35646]MEC2534077.1 protein phosphatase 2C domain-containing protein [Bacillus cereus]MED1153546.1 protein phosphatase 2C domain-containing protein [Bacillus paranthracis]OUB09161.1 protein phosphatase [Bacillus thuringiensis serovar yunnanensis]AFQ29874.1 protein serine/threonine phosphatase [Bacillus thuringiensis HD-789]